MPAPFVPVSEMNWLQWCTQVWVELNNPEPSTTSGILCEVPFSVCNWLKEEDKRIGHKSVIVLLWAEPKNKNISLNW
jgi:hypothetical protein